MVATAKLLTFIGFLLGSFSTFALLYNKLFANETLAGLSAAISMLVVGLAVAWIAGGRISNLSTRWLAKIEPWMDSCALEIEEWSANASLPTLRVSLIVTAALSLFLELVLIRWESGVFAVF